MKYRNQFQKMRIGVLVFTFCMFCLQVKSQNAESKLAKLYQKNKIEKLLKYSESDIKTLSTADDLRLLGGVFLNNYHFEQAEICYQKLLAEYDNLSLAEDYMNYYFCLLNLRKQNVILKSDKHKFDSNKWVSLLKSAAHFSNDCLSLKTLETTVLRNNISPLNGFSVTNDTIHYFAKQTIGDAILEETSEILYQRPGMANETLALLADDRVKKVANIEWDLRMASLKYSGVQVHVLKNAKDVFYSVESFKSGRQSILIKSDRVIPFPFNTEDYDCTMPFFNEKSQTLYFSSNMPGGYGNMDIYSCLFKDGKWLQPVNLGEEVNTPFTEIYPVYSSCGLLFSSNGRAGVGGFDNYLYSSDNQTSHNLYPYNSIGNDYGLQEIQNTSIGFKNENLVNYNSSLLNAYNLVKNKGKVLEASLYSEKIEEAKEVILVKEDSLKQIKLELKLEEQKIEKLEIENFIRNGQIYFASSQSIIEDSQFSILDSLCESILRLNAKQVYVLGYADISGSGASNNALSYRRSFSVINYLKAKGLTIEKVNLTPVAMGENLQLSNQINPKDRKVEFLMANEVPIAKGIVAISESKEEELSQLSNFVIADSSLPYADNLKYVLVRKLHKVLSGEDIFTISIQYKCPVKWIRQINSKKTNDIEEGEYLFIPANTELNQK